MGKPTARVLSTLRKLKHFAKVSFILQVANADFSHLPPLDMSDVETILEDLLKGKLIENRIINNRSFWRIVPQ